MTVTHPTDPPATHTEDVHREDVRIEAVHLEDGAAEYGALMAEPDPEPAETPTPDVVRARVHGDVTESVSDPAATDEAQAAPEEALSPPPAPVRREVQQAARARTFPRAERPAPVPAPDHHHLPGWVRRDFGKARPALADLLGLLQGDARTTLQSRVDELTAGINSGKFSLAWQYPQIIEEGRALYEGQREEIAESQRVQRILESQRRRAGDRLREAGDLLSSEAQGRLQRALRQAPDADAISTVQVEADAALAQARTGATKRRDREIARTRSRISSAAPQAPAVEEGGTETWQDVLRRFAQEQFAGDTAPVE